MYVYLTYTYMETDGLRSLTYLEGFYGLDGHDGLDYDHDLLGHGLDGLIHNLDGLDSLHHNQYRLGDGL